ncbi:MAG: malto-oligosyltrehalose synthase [Dehalococcoidia bacterium]
MPVDSPVATYRLQLHPGFTFEAAAAVVPYLRRLGISHLYLSPIWAATPGSTHGYDVIDHARINEELGGLAGFYVLAQAARDNGMQIILDIVPNHVGIAHHPWWRDVLRYGPNSQYAPYFDIDWEGQPQQAAGVLVYPVLGQPFGSALEAGELTLEYDGSEIVVRYYDRTFPVAPKLYAATLGLPPLGEDPEPVREVIANLEALATASPQSSEILLGRLAETLSHSPMLLEWVGERIATYNGTPGVPDSFNQLEFLLQQQPYRLAYWRVSAEEINYRRFFDINDLAAVRIEHEPAFEATHSLVRELVAGGLVSGLRVDHVDGLYDPAGYLARLAAFGGEPHIWVEKILAPGEQLPAHWPIDGTSGYEFLAMAGGLFVDPAAEQAFTAIYEDFIGAHANFADISFAARRRVAGRSFAGEVNVLALNLYRLAQERRLARDNTLGALREAIAALLASMPVYRTYLEHDEPMPNDSLVIAQAAAEALRRDPNVTPEAMRFLAQVLNLELEESSEEERVRWVHFRRRFQQLSGPVMAKGVEDTSFFRYHRLLALNEVGDHPEHFGVRPEHAHVWFAKRAETWPRALSASTTHDTKRSEDARMRLAALTAHPRAWHREVRAWARTNRRHIATVDGVEVPDRNTEYYLYQTLLASWEGPPNKIYLERIEEHMIKASREAKVSTSWTRVDDAYEAALTGFIRAIFDRRRSPAFQKRVGEFVASIEPIARMNTLGLLALKATAPGIPDFYQGSEFALHTLTDPDNRRDVDFQAAEPRLRGTDEMPAPTEAAAKPWLTLRLLALRREHPGHFLEASYEPIEVCGPTGRAFFAFQRVSAEVRTITVVLSRPGEVLGPDRTIAADSLVEAELELPGPGPWTEWLSGRRVHGTTVRLSEYSTEFPVAVFIAGKAATGV